MRYFGTIEEGMFIPADTQVAPAPPDWSRQLKVAVLIPCYNEEMTISRVVADFCTTLGGGHIYVYDNNSRDHTIAEARRAGAIVRSEQLQGKGHVVRRMFADIDADVYILVDLRCGNRAGNGPQAI
jgi:glycosyltransferase involved in cell wall biosynthesis